MSFGLNLIGFSKENSNETDYLYDLLQYKEPEDMKKVNNAYFEFSKLSHEQMIINRRREHPILHEVCEQAVHNFELLKNLWQLANLKPYWNNKSYTDKYGLTALERLSIRMHVLSNDKQKWIEENMGVKSVCDFENIFHPSGNYNVKYIRTNCHV